MPDPIREPSSDARQAARALRDMFVALEREGFTAQQALIIIVQVLAASHGTGDT